MRSPSRSMRVFVPWAPALLACLVLLLAGCGGGSGGSGPADDLPPPGTGGGGGGTPVLPPPAPPQTPVWDADAASYGRTALFGSFPSDLVLRGQTAFAVDADQVEAAGAKVLAFDIGGSTPKPSTQYATTTIHAADLVDSNGQTADLQNPVGFGFYLNDLLVVDDTLAFVLVNAGGSDSQPALSNVVAFDPTSGAVVQTVALTNTFVSPTPIADSTGLRVPGDRFMQSGAEGLEYVPTSGTRGRLFVAMSNLLFGAPSYGTTKYPGTIQVLEVDRSRQLPLGWVFAPGLVTETIVTQGYNPVAIQAILVDLAPQPPLSRLLVTVAGTTALDAQLKLKPLTASTVEAYDAATGAFEVRFDLGLAGLSAIRPAFGRDAAGHQVGFFPSAVTGEIYLLRLDGLYEEPVDLARLAVLRGPLDGIPITAAQSGGPGGNITGAALSPDGRLLAVTGFGDLFASPAQPGRLFLLTLPDDVVTGSAFGASFVPGSTEFAVTPGRTLGKVVLAPNDGSRPDVFVNVSGTLDANFFGSGPASLGTLQTHGLVR